VAFGREKYREESTNVG